MSAASHLIASLFDGHRIDEVIPGRLYIGSEEARDPEVLDEHWITHVVCLQPADERRLHRHQKLPARVEEKTYNGFKDDRGTLITEYIPLVFEYIDDVLGKDPKARVLVHCAAGISRSGAMVTAYLMYKYDLPADEALARLRKARPCVHPNDSFAWQLRHLVPALLVDMRNPPPQ